MSEAELLTEIKDGVATITFNRPKARNALTTNMVTLMREFLKQVEFDPAVRCIVMQGAGDHFMAGGDVAGFGKSLEASSGERRRDFEQRAAIAVPIFQVLERMEKPVIAKVRGACAGASVGWVAASDFALVSDNSLFLVAHVLLGTSPDGAVTWHLPRAVGLRKAKEMALLGGKVLAQEAVDFGLANRVVADADLDAETDKLAQRLAGGPTTAIGRTKVLLNQSFENSLATQMQLEAESFGLCAGTDDFVEGVTSFLEKRKASFKGS